MGLEAEKFNTTTKELAGKISGIGEWLTELKSLSTEL
jgi:hypothetical protein